MSGTEQPNIAALAEEIRCYLQHHPMAADSAAGVLMWWLLRQRLGQNRDDVQRALDYLVAAGAVAKRTTPDGTAIYAAKDNTQLSHIPANRGGDINRS